MDAEVKRISPKSRLSWAAPWGPVDPREHFGRAGSKFAPPWPALALATGRTTIPYLRALKRRAGLATYTAVLMDPRTGASTADLIWVPEHDKRQGPNVIRTIAAPHRYSPARINELRAATPAAIAALPHPRIAVLIGGPNAVYPYSERDIERLSAALIALAQSGAGLMVTPSRRTPEALLARLRSVLAPAHALLWDGTGQNPYPDFLANADAFVVTADSVSMTCEAAATGRPIYVFEPEGGGGKFAKFHSALRGHGATRPLPAALGTVENWTYVPLDSATIIAGEIERRWQKRAAWIAQPDTRG
mgnify:CR=1 FL=1